MTTEPGPSRKNWNDYKWQLQNAIKTKEQLKEFLPEQNFDFLDKALLNVKISPYYANLIKDKPHLLKTVIPNELELTKSTGESIDPLGEESSSPVPGIVHRYPDRVLFLTTNVCGVHCRYCTRSRVVDNSDDNFLTKKSQWDNAINYIRNNNQIRDIILSGGDPLSLSDTSIDYLLTELRKIKHVEIIRIGTKIPIALPMRITPQLLKIIKKHHPVYFSVHCTHPDEFTTKEVKLALSRIANAGIIMRSQTVLLKDVNNNPETMKKLMHELLKNRIVPYYIYAMDAIFGSNHFKASIKDGLNIMENLRGWTSGYAIPSFVIDAPNGGGKIPLLPNYVKEMTDDKIILRNYKNITYEY